VIEVTIGSDGRLVQSVIRRSSGHAELDEAAMRILKLAAPYDRFPSALGAAHDQGAFVLQPLEADPAGERQGQLGRVEQQQEMALDAAQLMVREEGGEQAAEPGAHALAGQRLLAGEEGFAHAG